MILIAIWICFGFGTLAIGASKGYKTGTYFALGFLLGPIGLIIAACDKPITIDGTASINNYQLIRFIQNKKYLGIDYYKDKVYNMQISHARVLIKNGYAVSVSNPAKEENQNDKLSQLKQLKELLDMGAITEEEFNKKKRELL